MDPKVKKSTFWTLYDHYYDIICINITKNTTLDTKMFREYKIKLLKYIEVKTSQKRDKIMILSRFQSEQSSIKRFVKLIFIFWKKPRHGN